MLPALHQRLTRATLAAMSYGAWHAVPVEFLSSYVYNNQLYLGDMTAATTRQAAALLVLLVGCSVSCSTTEITPVLVVAWF